MSDTTASQTMELTYEEYSLQDESEKFAARLFALDQVHKASKSLVVQSTEESSPLFPSAETLPIIRIPTGIVGVVLTNVDEYSEGLRGIQMKPLFAGTHAINTRTHSIEPVPVYNITLEWSEGQKDMSRYDAELKPIKLRSKDGFEFEIEISQAIRIRPDDAPRLVSEIGFSQAWSSGTDLVIDERQKFSVIRNLISRLLKPTVETHFRNVAQNYDAIDFYNVSEKLQAQAAEDIGEALSTAGVDVVRMNISLVALPDEVVKTQIDAQRQSKLEKP